MQIFCPHFFISPQGRESLHISTFSFEEKGWGLGYAKFMIHLGALYFIAINYEQLARIYKQKLFYSLVSASGNFTLVYISDKAI